MKQSFVSSSNAMLAAPIAARAPILRENGRQPMAETDLLALGALRLARYCARRSAPDMLPFRFQ
jgi:hypothetical protein